MISSIPQRFLGQFSLNLLHFPDRFRLPTAPPGMKLNLRHYSPCRRPLAAFERKLLYHKTGL
jgi:hypothetical protein